MSFSENKGLWITVILFLITIGVLFWIIAGSTPFQLVILFDETGDLKEGDPVVWKNFNIGRVEKIQPLVENQVGVMIRLKADYAGSITRGSEFVLRRASFLGLVGDNAIEILTPAERGAPYVNGEKIKGKAVAKPSPLTSGVKWTSESLRELRDQTSRLLEEFKSSPFREDAANALAELRDLAEQGSRQALDGLEQFGRDHQKDFDAAVRKLEQLRDKLRKKGDEGAARRVEEEITRIQSPTTGS